MVRLYGVDQIVAALTAMGAVVQESAVSVLPYVPSRAELEGSLAFDMAMLQRGVTTRSLMPRAAHEPSWILAYARHAEKHGAQVRSGLTGTVRYVVYDRSVALVAEGRAGTGKAGDARLICSEGIVQALLMQFELAWAQSSDLSTAWAPLTEREERVLRAVIRDVPVKAIAAGLRVSVSTVERTIVRLRERFDAPTRAALAVEATRLGWTGEAPPR
ncbi:helix-turn-helix transcriptional regulator [Xylanimonas protaetiae]|uniref:helix-turn-helix transcriptional regulator n=1 Tax=Xylanimonas protaetiae TaxID=2509457 RepID=UPI0013EBFDBC|nr:LuxR C-terminal-related transcriptional regulator [Xylanimonas protaetiae]